MTQIVRAPRKIVAPEDTRKKISSHSKCGDVTRLKNKPVTITLPSIKGLKDDGDSA